MKSLLILLTTLTVESLSAQQYGWQVIARPRPGYQILTVEFKDSLHGWCGARDSLYRTMDGGRTWLGGVQNSLPNYFTDMSFSDTLYGWATGTFSGSEGLVWRTTNGGQSWSEKLFLNDRRYNGTSAWNTLRNTTVGSVHRMGFPDTGKLITTIDGGVTWNERTVADSIWYLGKIQFVDSLHGWVTYLALPYIFNSHPGVLRTEDGGKSWNAVALPRPVEALEGLKDISFVDSLHGWASSYNSSSVFRVLSTSDGGRSWQIIYTNIGDIHSEAISFVDTLNGWMFGGIFYQGDIRNLIMRTADGGTTWIQESIGIAGYLSDGLMTDRYHGWAVSYDGEVLGYSIITGVIEHLPDLPLGFNLKQNYPNPFNNTTVIEYEIPTASNVHIAIYDEIGKLVTTLVSQYQTSGVYRVQFDPKSLSSGIYYYSMKALQFQSTKQLVLVK